MADNHEHKDPFNWGYFFLAVAALLAFPLLHVVLGVGKYVFGLGS